MWTYESEDGESSAWSERVQLTRRDLSPRTLRGIRRELIADGVLPEPGCDCAHCANGWDCCGRMVPQRIAVVSVSRRRCVAVLRIDYRRNI